MSQHDPEKTGPANEWSEKVQTIMDEMRRRKLCDFRRSGAWRPLVNLYECRDTYHVCIELAGVELGVVEVRCRETRQLCVQGQRVQPRTTALDESFSIQIMEIDEGPFEREIELPADVEPQPVDVRHERGFLWVILRKRVND